MGDRAELRREFIVSKQKRAVDATAESIAASHRHDIREKPSQITIAIYIAQHCRNCAYAYEVAAEIRRQFPQAQVRLIDMANSGEPIPEAVFATPTYLLNGRVWSLGNPSPAQVYETLTALSVVVD